MSGKYIKTFKEWNHFKEILDSVDITIPFYVGEIWYVAIGVNIGIEIDGKGENFERPVLVIKKFNKFHALVVPITSAKHDNFSTNILVVDKSLSVGSTVVISQIMRISNHRFLYRIGILDKTQFKKVVNSIKEMF